MSNIYKALATVQSEISKAGIAKAQKNQGQGFNFRGIDDVLNALSPILSENGVVIVPESIDHNIQTQVGANGKPVSRVIVKVGYRIYADDGSNIPAFGVGEALDQSDKATGKAQSMAYKQMCFNLFCIPLVGAPDADHDNIPVTESAARPDQVKAIHAFCASNELDKATVLEYLSKGLKMPLSSFGEIPESRFDSAFAALKAKQEKKVAQPA